MSPNFKISRWDLIVSILLLMPNMASALDYFQATKFSDSSIVTVYDKMAGRCVPDSNSMTLETLRARSRLECTRACTMRSACGSVNFNTVSRSCVLLDLQLFTDGRDYQMENDPDWTFIYDRKTTFKKGWLGIDGRSVENGRAMVFINGNWGTVCDPSPSDLNWPKAFCVDLGYDRADAKHSDRSYYGVGSGNIGWMWPNCRQNFDLHDCLGVSDGPCTHEDDVSIRCKD